MLAIVLTTGLFFAVTWGYVRLAAQSPRLPDRASLLSDHHALLALGALAAIGLLAGILIAAPRVSPLAAGLPGLLLLGLTALHLASVHRADQLIPLKSQVFGMGFETLLTRGMLGAAGAAMIVPLFVPSRWRGRDGADIAGEFGPAGIEDTELAGVVIPGIGDMPVAGTIARADDSAASAQPPAGGGCLPAGVVHHGALPYRTRPPGIVY